MGWNVEAGRNVTPSPPNNAQKSFGYSRRTKDRFAWEAPVCMCTSVVEWSRNLDLQEIAVLGPYSGVFASTPCSIFGLHEVDQDKAMFECGKEQAFISV